MQWSDDVRIETPEQIDLSLEIAGLGSRFAARVVDWLIKWGTLVGVGVLVLIILSLLGATFSGKAMTIVLGAFLVGLFYAFLLGFDIYFEVRHNGQTPGKKYMGIRVLREGGAPLDFRSACVRNLIALADFLPVFYLLGGLIVLLSPRGQRLGDMAAGTIVIRERAVQPPPELDEKINDLALEDLAFTAKQLNACSPADRHVLRSFFQRHRQMDPEARDQLAYRLMKTFKEKMAYPSASPVANRPDAEGFLASLYRDLQKWARHGT
jgi:uncharacterized RDD family membrane protein YckC